MSRHIEQLILRNHDERETIWSKPSNDLDSENQQIYRTIRIGYIMNCNGEIIRDQNTYRQIKYILEKYNINPDKLKEIEEKTEHAVELKLQEAKYQKLINNIKSNYYTD
jgi:hypothetical protein